MYRLSTYCSQFEDDLEEIKAYVQKKIKKPVDFCFQLKDPSSCVRLVRSWYDAEGRWSDQRKQGPPQLR